MHVWRSQAKPGLANLVQFGFKFLEVVLDEDAVAELSERFVAEQFGDAEIGSKVGVVNHAECVC